MATFQKRINRAMWLNNVDIIQYPTEQAVEDGNVIIHQIEDFITSAIGEGYFWDILTATSTIVGQNEYSIPTIDTGSFNGAPKIESISIKYDDNSDFIKADWVNRETLEHDLDYYKTSQSPSSPFFFIADNSIFIYPSPTVAVTGGIKMYGIKSLGDITETTDETSIFGGKIPTKYFYVISEGMTQFIKKSQNKEQESLQAKIQFENVILPSLVEKIGNRKVGISERKSPNINAYKK